MYKFFVVDPKREKNIFKWVGPWQDLLFFLFIYLFIYTFMFPACFCLRTYMAQGLVNGILNVSWVHLCLLFE